MKDRKSKYVLSNGWTLDAGKGIIERHTATHGNRELAFFYTGIGTIVLHNEKLLYGLKNGKQVTIDCNKNIVYEDDVTGRQEGIITVPGGTLEVGNKLVTIVLEHNKYREAAAKSNKALDGAFNLSIDDLKRLELRAQKILNRANAWLNGLQLGAAVIIPIASFSVGIMTSFGLTMTQILKSFSSNKRQYTQINLHQIVQFLSVSISAGIYLAAIVIILLVVLHWAKNIQLNRVNVIKYLLSERQ